jgi:hypothetical protein
LLTLLIISAMFLFINPIKAQMVIESDGDVGIHSLSTDASADIFLNGSVKIFSHSFFSKNGTFRPLSSSNSNYIGNSTFPFQYIHGTDIWANGSLLNGSDRRFKENFREIESPLEKLLQLNGLKYDFISDNADTLSSPKEKEKKELLRKDKMGLVAQDVLEVLPDAVEYDKEIDRYYLDYNAILTLVVEAMKEQQATINQLNDELDNLKSEKTMKSASLDTENLIEETKEASLQQNIPNPFSATTKINMYLPETTSTAKLYLYTMQGEQVSSYPVQERGNTSVTIEGYTMKAGMYLYTLIADGKEVDTKKMILTEQ